MSRTRFALGTSLAVAAAPALLAGAVALMHLADAAPPLPAADLAQVKAFESQPQPQLGVFRASGGVPRTASAFAATLGQTPKLVLEFTGFGGSKTHFPGKWAEDLWEKDHHAKLLIQLNPGANAADIKPNAKVKHTVLLQNIASGVYDNWLRRYARAVVRFGHPVVIGFAHEMNGWWYPWGYHNKYYDQRPADFIAAWQHIVTVFRSQNAKNVIWLWTISHTPHSPAATKATAPLSVYWPGSEYVTWVGIDGYYYHRTDTFGSVFRRQILNVRSLPGAAHIPILLSEVGIGGLAGQAHSIPGLIRGISAYHLRGAIWFDVNQRCTPGDTSCNPVYQQDWAIENHSKAIKELQNGWARLQKNQG